MLANFIAKFTMTEDSSTSIAELWIVQTDGLSAKVRGGVGVVITSQEGDILKYEVQL